LKLKHIAVLTIIKQMVHKNVLLSLCWLLVTAGTLCHLCSVIALLADFNIFYVILYLQFMNVLVGNLIPSNKITRQPYHALKC